MMNKFAMALVMISLILFSCQQEEKQEGFRVEAKLTNIANGTLFHLKSQDTGRKIDSAYVINGRLLLKGQLDRPYPEKLFLSGVDSLSQEFIYTYLHIGNEQITFQADKMDFPWNINAEGSVAQDKAEKINRILFQKQEMSNQLRTTYSEDKALLSKKTAELSDSMDRVIIALMKEDFNSYAALSFFKYYKTEFSSEELKQLYGTLSPELKQTTYAKAVKLQSDYPMPKVGDQYYDYAALNQNGDTIALSEIKDRYILLHFASSGCYGSQLSLPELKEVDRQHQSFLEIVSISEDIQKEHWQNSVVKDSISWNYLWDGKGDYNDAVVKYWESGTPNYVLISPDKTILERWFGYRDGIIKEKIEKYLN